MQEENMLSTLMATEQAKYAYESIYMTLPKEVLLQNATF